MKCEEGECDRREIYSGFARLGRIDVRRMRPLQADDNDPYLLPSALVSFFHFHFLHLLLSAYICFCQRVLFLLVLH